MGRAISAALRNAPVASTLISPLPRASWRANRARPAVSGMLGAHTAAVKRK